MFPSVDLDALMITTRYPGASPEDVELNVTNKIEDELKGIDGIEKLTSYSMENISVINISIDPDAKDKDEVKRDIRDGSGRVSDLPARLRSGGDKETVITEGMQLIFRRNMLKNNCFR